MNFKISIRQMILFLFMCTLIFLPLFSVSAYNVNENAFDYYIGTGKYDITGPPAEVVMMGYADSNQKTEGIHMRLQSRAFVIQEKNSDDRVVFVSADLGQIFHSVKQGVMDKLSENGLGHLYRYENVVMSATHTHSGPGGYAHDGLYNFSTYGFHKQNYKTIVEGIYQSIVKAHQSLAPGYIDMAKTNISGVSANRSLDAYDLNPQSERSQYASTVDETMTQLNLRDEKGHLRGIINWFPVHGVSMGKENHLISGDNKGYAAYRYEKEFGSSFVAAFAQSNEGDITPNVRGDGEGLGENDYENTEKAGEIQYLAAKSLSYNASERIQGGIAYKHQFIDFSNIKVDKQFADGQDRRTYPGALGHSFAAGTEDGKGPLDFFYEGMTQPEYDIDDYDNIIPYLQKIIRIVPQVGEMSGSQYPELWEQHYPKPILFAPSKVKPDAWTPQEIPLQLVNIGQFSIASVPAEFTSMAGRRLKEQIQQQFQTQGGKEQTVVIAGLANSYSGYVTTPEEYHAQHYEGASTHFGKWTLGAYLQKFDALTDAIITHRDIDPGRLPKDLSEEQLYLLPGVVFDAAPLFKDFGDVKENVKKSYQAGDQVKVKFWSGHPNNNFKTASTYLKVQNYKNGDWVTVADDGDWETQFKWTRQSTLGATSYVTITWNIPENVKKGTYRIVHEGTYKKVNGKMKNYQGASSSFKIED
ncbi:neutral/alkaline ceramidase [Hazenella sp. IB182357]|uniref:Neutral ceramidase n=1 Tax=Polycladospora coralii TaxID=2771432 RepID=A0A926N8F7_9BACL|nr:neutral/alkaline non-lysosomal ceramidase N-terminal domain-containing protein [Polycladospora coralii]MBD1371558.1 neutral/alkaline ceramidase [Polycladospora coralii]